MNTVYFACSIRGGRDDAVIYKGIIDSIKKHSTVLSEVFADDTLTPMGSSGSSRDIWEQDLKWVQEADIVIAEVTNPSLGVGYEIAKAESWSKPILCLYREQEGRRLSAMIDGSPNCTVVRYNSVAEVENIIQNFINTQNITK